MLCVDLKTNSRCNDRTIVKYVVENYNKVLVDRISQRERDCINDLLLSSNNGTIIPIMKMAQTN